MAAVKHTNSRTAHCNVIQVIHVAMAAASAAQGYRVSASLQTLRPVTGWVTCIKAISFPVIDKARPFLSVSHRLYSWIVCDWRHVSPLLFARNTCNNDEYIMTKPGSPVSTLISLDTHTLDGQEHGKCLPNLVIQPKLLDGVDVDLVNHAQHLQAGRNTKRTSSTL